MQHVGRLILAAALSVVFSGSAVADPAFPDSPSGRQAEHYVAALNRGDVPAFAAYLKQNYPASPFTASQIDSAHSVRGPLKLIAVTSASDTTLTALVEYPRFEVFREMRIDVDPAPPHRIVALKFTPTTPAGATGRVDDARLAALLPAKIADLGDDFSGAVLVARDGRVVASAAAGYADRARKTRVGLDTRFRVGSMDKMFTAVAIGQLDQAGKLSLDAPLATYLPDYPNAALARAVTIRQLLNHTGGTGDIFGPEFDAHRDTLRGPQDYIALYGARPAQFPAGAHWDYSNYGYILLGRVIEKVSGQSYFDYVQTHVFVPAGMTGTGFAPETDPVAGRAQPYVLEAGEFKLVTDSLPWRGTPAGGGYSTVGDMLAFARALYGGKLMDAAHVHAFTTGSAEMPGGQQRYGYGFSEMTVGDVRTVGHSGGALGMSGDLVMIDNARVVIVTLSNVAPPGFALGIADYLAAHVAVR